MKDTPRHQGLRNKLVQEIINKGISHPAVIEAIAKIPRHVFFESALESHAYQDKAFPIAAGQTISQPYTVAFQSELLDVKSGMKVLEIGTGSGYQTSVLIELGAQVYTIERQKVLFAKAKNKLRSLDYFPKYIGYGDGYKGLPTYAPFDRIIVTAAAPEIPEELIKQLKIGGKMVIPVGQETQKMFLIEKNDEGIRQTEHGMFRFVPMLKDKE